MPAPFLDDYKNYTDRRTRDQVADGIPPLVSVITVALNAAATLERTIRSVQAQTMSSTEHIFVDGGSSDGTLEIIRRLARPQDYWISEKDKGISDAFNKGVAMARGRYVQILNADDWLSTDQLGVGCATLRTSGADFVFGDLLFYDQNRPSFIYVGDPSYARVIDRRMPAISHPTVLASRTTFARIGLFDLKYRNAMDYDWFLRLHKAGGVGAYSPEIRGHMTHAGVSNRQFKRTIDEVKEIAVAHGRNRLIAATEARARYMKTAASQPVKRHAAPLYQLIRRVINPAYAPARADGT